MFQKRKSSLFNLNFLIILVKVINLLTIKKCKYWTPPLPLGITREKNPFYNLQGKLQVFIFSFNVLVWMVMTPFERDKWPMGPFSKFKRWEGEGFSIPSLLLMCNGGLYLWKLHKMLSYFSFVQMFGYYKDCKRLIRTMLQIQSYMY